MKETTKKSKMGAPLKFGEPLVDRVVVLVPRSTHKALKEKAAELNLSIGELSRRAFSTILSSS